MRPSPRLIVLLLVCASLIGASFAQERPQPTPEQQRAQAEYLRQQEELRSRYTQIRDEIAAIKAGKIEPGADWAEEWAGQYYCGDGTGMNVRIAIAPRGGMTYAWTGCLGLYEFNYGQIVEATRDSILVRLELPIDPEGFLFISERLYFVRWGEHRFLVPKRSMLELIGWLNAGDDFFPCLDLPYAGEPHRLRAAPPGLPEIPDEFRPLVFTAPLEISLTSARLTDLQAIGARTRCWKFDVVLDKGRLDGIHENIRIERPWGLPGSVVITKLDDRGSEARLILVTTEADRAGHPVVGDTLTLPAGARALPRAIDPNRREGVLLGQKE